MKTIEDVKNIVSILTEEQKQVLKDCITKGFGEMVTMNF